MPSPTLLQLPDPDLRVAVPPEALVQQGLFTRSQARAAGWGDGRQRRALRDGTWRHVAGSVLVARGVTIGPWEAARAVGLSGRVASHHTAGGLWGLEVPLELHGIVGHGAGPARGLTDHRLPLRAGDVIEVAGLCVTSWRRTLADLLCLLPVEASIVLVTDGLRRSILTVADLERAAAVSTRRRGARSARLVASTCAGRPWSLLEWRFQQLAPRAGVGWRFNEPIGDARGPIGAVDAVHDAARVVVELDGKRYHAEDRFQRDRTRDQRLVALGYVVLRFTWQDVAERPDYVVEVLRRTIRGRLRLGTLAS